MLKTYDIPDEVRDAVCSQYGYKDLIDDNLNPQSKDDFFDQVSYQFWKEAAQAYLTNQAVELARKNAVISPQVLNLGAK